MLRVRLMSLVDIVAVLVCTLCLGSVLCLQLLVVCPCLLVVIFVVASCRLSSGDVESRESVTSTRAHTSTQKKFAPVIRVVVVTRRVVTYGVKLLVPHPR
jgi:hypothetical protein